MRKLLCALLPFASTAAFAATDIYVAADGDDANDGLSRATAKATIPAGYAVLTNGTPDVTYGNRLVVGEGTFDLPTCTTVLSNGWKVVGAGKDKTTLKVTKKTRQFTLASDDTELRGLRIDFIGSSMDMTKDVDNGNAYLYGALALNPEGTLADLDVANYYTSWNGTLLHISAAGVSPVVSNCVFRNFHIHYRNPLVQVNNVAASPLFTHCAFIDGTCSKYWTPGTIYLAGGDSGGSTSTIRNCLFLRCENYQDHHKDKYRTATIYCCGKSTIENCSIINCTFKGEGFNEGYEAWADLCGPIIRAGRVVNTLVYGCTNSNGELQPCRAGTYSYCANDAALLAGEGNIKVEPGSIRFQNARDDRFVPVAGPTVDSASEVDWMAGSADLLGRSRINGAAPDIGCYEYHEPNKYYVAKDGDDANDGLTPETAKATIAAGCALLSDVDEKVFVGGGDYPLPGETVVLTNGWAIEGVDGPESTRLYATSADHVLFSLATPGTLLRGLRIDFCNLSFATPATQCMFLRVPLGCVENCIVERFRYTGYDQGGMSSVVRVGLDGAAPVFSNMVIRSCYQGYRSSFVTIYHESSPLFVDCKFVDLKCGNYYSYGIVYVDNKGAKAQFRNCLFHRCETNQDTHKDKYRTGLVNFRYQAASAYVDNCTFLDCRFFGSAFDVEDTTWATSCGPVIRGGNVRNCLFVACTNKLAETQFESWTTGTKPTWSHCAADTALDGDGNIVVGAGDIKFRRPSKGDYSARRGPTIDAGEALSWHAGAKDLFGRDRVIGGAPDIGAFEYDFDESGAVMLLR